MIQGIGRTGAVLLAVMLLGACGSDGQSADDGYDLTLPPEDMPAWNGSVVWSGGIPDDAPVLQVCELPDLGAPVEAGRDYTWPEGGMGGTNVVSEYDSESDAQAAIAELESHFRECTGDGQISDLGTGSTWTTCAPVPESDECRFEFAGVDIVDNYTTVVAFSLTAQDANYESDPLADSLAASTARIAAQ